MLFCQECGRSQPDSTRYCSHCGAKLAEGEKPVANPLQAPGAGAVKILDGGDKLVFSGGDSGEVEAMLQKYLRRGARVITPLSAVGRNWAAACTIPPATKSLDETQTLNLAEIPREVLAPPPLEPKDDGCRVEEIGFKRLVYGPTRDAVQARLDWMKHQGAAIVGNVEHDGAQWVGMCDLAGHNAE